MVRSMMERAIGRGKKMKDYVDDECRKQMKKGIKTLRWTVAFHEVICAPGTRLPVCFYTCLSLSPTLTVLSVFM